MGERIELARSWLHTVMLLAAMLAASWLVDMLVARRRELQLSAPPNPKYVNKP